MPYFCFHGFSFTPAKLCLLGAITSFTSRFQTFDVFTFQLLQSTVAGSVGSGSLFVLSCRPLAAPSALLCCLGREKKCFLCTAQNEVLGLRERWGYKAAFVCSLLSGISAGIQQQGGLRSAPHLLLGLPFACCQVPRSYANEPFKKINYLDGAILWRIAPDPV